MRSRLEQDSVDREAANMVLYGYSDCPYCFKVCRLIDRLSLRIVMRDIKRCESYRYELLAQGGRAQVPCLRITHRNGKDSWLYEASAIMEYLHLRYGSGDVAPVSPQHSLTS